jgi:hypothetical protein
VAAHLIAVGVTGNTPWQGAAGPNRQTAPAELCAECATPIDGWGCWYSDGAGELVPFCHECSEREFGGRDASAASSRSAA